jgi:hypothetical protein
VVPRPVVISTTSSPRSCLSGHAPLWYSHNGIFGCCSERADMQEPRAAAELLRAFSHPTRLARAKQQRLTECCGDPSSLHWAGVPARDAIETARSRVAALPCCDATDIVFTSGGTEANDHAIKRRVLLGAVRMQASVHHHRSDRASGILEPCGFLEWLGADVARLPVDRAHAALMREVAQMLHQQLAFLRHVIRHHGLKRIHIERLTEQDCPLYNAKVDTLRDAAESTL